MHDL